MRVREARDHGPTRARLSVSHRRDALIRMGLLTEDQRQDPEALQTAVLGVVYQACEDAD
jgi:hypothetical protein